MTHPEHGWPRPARGRGRPARLARLSARACAALVGAATATAATASPGPFFGLERYGLDEGLSQLTVTAMVEDDLGFLWVATQEGLNRFDGHRFEVWRRDRPEGEPGLVSSSIDALALDGRSRLWVGTNDAGLEVIDLRTRHHRRLGLTEGLSHPTVGKILLDPEGGAWLGTAAGIDRVDDELSSARPLGATAAVVAMVRGRQGAFALDRGCRVWKLERETVRLLASDLAGQQPCVAMQPSREGVWVATSQHGLFEIGADGVVARRLRLSGLDAGAELTALALVGEDEWLLGLADGKVLQAAPGGEPVLRAVELEPPLDSAVTSILRLRSGVLWLGTHTRGLFRVRALSNALPRHLVSDEDLAAWPSRSVRSVWSDPHHLMVGTDAGLVVRRRGAAVWHEVSALGVTSIRRILPARLGGWWIGTHRGLWHLSPALDVRELPGLPDDRVTDLLEEGEHLWVATRGGLARFRSGELDPAPLPPDLDGQFLTTLLRDDLGRLWIGTNERGLYRLGPDGALEHLDVAGGGLVNDSVWSLHADSEAFWVGTFSGGLQRIDRESGAVRTFTERQGLSNDVVYRIEPDRRGRLWLSTNRGLSVLDPRSGRLQIVTGRDGLRNREFNSGASFTDPQGRIYFGGTEGLDIIEPLELPRRSPPAVPVLTGLRVLGRRELAGAGGEERTDNVAYSERVELGHRDHVLSLRLVAIDFSSPDAAHLRYRIEGVHHGWILATEPQAELLLSYLPPGRYALEAQAAGRDGRFGRTRRVVIAVAPPPWRGPWAYAGYAMMLLLLLAWVWLRIGARRSAELAQIELLNRTVAERTAELERANELLQSSNLQLERAIRTDPLTQLSNRRDLTEWLWREGSGLTDEATRNRRCLLFFMIDVDDFKPINDRHGHQAGDEVLVAFAHRLRALCRERDAILRWGGDEFLLAVREARLEDAAPLAERIRQTIAGDPVTLRGGQRLAITCSIGFAPWPFGSAWTALEDWEHSVSLADRALYAAKASGKNAWVGLVPGRGSSEPALAAMLADAAPEELEPEAIAVLHSTAAPPRFTRA